MANEIRLPISLSIQNLKEILDKLKSELSNLKIGSSGFKLLESNIKRIEAEMDKLQVQASKPMISEKQFSAADKSVDKIEQQLEQLRINASRIKFSDLKLDSSQLAELKAVEDQIANIKTQLSSLKQEAKSAFLSSDMGKIWSDMHPEDAAASFEQITAKIRKEVAAQNAIVQKAEQEIEKYNRVIARGDVAEKVAATKGSGKDPGALRALTGESFNQFFSTRSDGGVAFKSKQHHDLFEAWLQKNFDIDPAVIKDLAQKKAPEIAAALNDASSAIRAELQKKAAAGVQARSARGIEEQKYDDARAKLEQLSAVMNAAQQISEKFATSEDNLKGKVSDLNGVLDQLKEKFTQSAQNSKALQDGARNGAQALQGMRDEITKCNAAFLKQQRTLQNFNAIKMTILNFMGFRQVLNLIKRGVQEAMNHIKELDSVMNKISIVTDLSTSDLWSQIDAYSEMAQKYGTSIKGAYEVSQIYYQQGLDTAEVLTLTNETLKLAKISGLDYAQTTDYMTTAIRGFKMEAEDASRVVDVYSNLAAHTAVSQEELAVAMSKTASSLESVGVSFEEGSAMIGTMVAVTRESATNIGSALKSIASRYGEMKKDPLALVDAEGDAMDYNKVDAALRSVGISLKDDNGQFRNMTDVIMELATVWDQLESTQQRYIATQFAGNRQQSRFLALVSNKDLLSANLKYAENSEDTGDIQALKALDSIEAKTEQVRVAYQQMYTTIGAENLWKNLLDGAKNFMDTLNRLPKLFGAVPIGAVAMVADSIKVIKDIGLAALGGISGIWDKIFPVDVIAGKVRDVQNQINKEINASATDKKTQQEQENVGKQATQNVAKGEKKASEDATSPANKEQRADTTAAPVVEKTAEAAAKMEELSATTNQAGTNAQNLANSVGQVAASAKEAKDALQDIASTKESGELPIGDALADKIDKAAYERTIAERGSELRSKVQEISSSFLPQAETAIGKTDFSDTEAAIESLKAKFEELKAANPELEQAFQEAGDMAIKGLVQGLQINDKPIDIASQTGQAIIAALKAAMGCHSPSVPADEAGRNVGQGVANGLSASIDNATNKAREMGISVVSALKDELQSLDPSKLLPVLEPTLDLSKLSVEELEQKEQEIAQKVQQMQADIAADPKAYKAAVNPFLQDTLAKIDKAEQQESQALWQEYMTPDVLRYYALQGQIKTQTNHANSTIDFETPRAAQFQKQIDELKSPEAIDKREKELTEKLKKESGYSAAIQDNKALDKEERELQEKIAEKEQALEKIKKGKPSQYKHGQAGLNADIKDAENQLKEKRKALENFQKENAERRASNNDIISSVDRKIKSGELRTEAEADISRQIDELKAQKEASSRRLDHAKEILENPEKALSPKDAAEYLRLKESVQGRVDEYESKRAEVKANADAARTAARDQFNAFTPKNIGKTLEKSQSDALEKISTAKTARIQRDAQEKATRAAQEEEAAKRKAEDEENKRLTQEAVARSKTTPEKTETTIDFTKYKTVQPEVRDREAFTGTLATGTPQPVKMATWSELGAAASGVSVPVKPDEASVTETGKQISSKVQSTVDENPAEVKTDTPKTDIPQGIMGSRAIGFSLLGTTSSKAMTPNISGIPRILPASSTSIMDSRGVGFSLLGTSPIKEMIPSVSGIPHIPPVSASPASFMDSRAIGFSLVGTPSTDESKTNAPEASQSNITSDIESINQKIAALERLKAAQDAVKNTEKGTQENTDAMTERRNAAAEARGLGMEDIRYNTSNLDERIFQLKAQLDETSAQSAGEQAATNAQEAVDGNPLTAPEIQGADQVGTDAGEKASEAAQNAFKAPELTNSPYNVYRTGEGGDLVPETSKSIDQLLSKLQQIGTISEEQKAKLQELFETRPTAEFVDAYNAAIGSGDKGQRGSFEAPTDTIGVNVYNTPMMIHPITESAEEATGAVKKVGEAGAESGEKVSSGAKEGVGALEEVKTKADSAATSLKKTGEAGQQAGKQSSKGGLMASSGWGTFGAALSMISGLFSKATIEGQVAAGAISAIGGIIRTVSAISQAAAGKSPWMALAMGIMAFVNGISMAWETDEERLERYKKEAEEFSNKAKQAKSDLKELKTGKEKLEELKEKRYESAEAAEEYQSTVDDLANKFPELITGFDEAGNAIIEAGRMEQVLASARLKTANATYEAAKAEKKGSAEEFRQKTEQLSESVQKIQDEITQQSVNGNIVQSAESNVAYVIDKAYGEGEIDESTYTALMNAMSSTYKVGSWTKDTLASKIAVLLHNNELPLTEAYMKDSLNLELLGTKPTVTAKEFGLEEYYNVLKAKFDEDESQLSDTDLDMFKILDLLYGTDKNEAIDEVNWGDVTSSLQILSQDLSNGNLSAALQEYNKIQAYLNDLSKDIEKFDHESSQYKTFTKLQTMLNDAGIQIIDLQNQAAIDAANSKALATAYVSRNQGLSFISENSGLASIIGTNYGIKYDEKFAKNQNYTNEEFESDYGPEMTIAANAAEQFWKDLAFHGKERKDKFVKMLQNIGDYRQKDFEDFNDIKEWDAVSGQLSEYIQGRIDEVRENLSNFYTDKLKKRADDHKADSAEQQQWYKDWQDAKETAETYTEQKYLVNAFNAQEALYDSGFVDDAKTYGEKTLAIYSNISTMADEDLRNELWKSIEKNGLKTKEGIQKIITSIENTESTEDDKIIPALEELQKLIQDNISLAVQTMMDNFLEDWKDGSKLTKKLTSGMDLSDVNEVLNSSAGKKAKIQLSDFKQDGEKLVLTEEAAKNYMTEYFADMDESIRNRRKELKKATEQFGSIDEKTNVVTILSDRFSADEELSPEDKKALNQLLGTNVYENYLTDGKLDTAKMFDKEGNNLLIQAILEAYKDTNKQIDELELYRQTAAAQIEKTFQWKKGNFQSVTKIYKDMTDRPETLGEVTDEAVLQHLRDLASYTADFTEAERKEPDILNAVKQIREATSNYVSDLLNKNLEQLYAGDYLATGRGEDQITREIQTAIDYAKNNSAKEFAQWISSLSKQAGQSISEQNDSFVKAWDKINTKNTAKGLSDLQFIDKTSFQASTDQLKNFADTYELSLNDLVTRGLANYLPDLDKWVVDYAKLDATYENIDFSKMEGFTETVQDSINEFWKNLGELIKKGINGSLTNVEFKQLQGLAKQIGFNGTLDFTQTAEGLKLSETAAIGLYTQLNAVNSLQAQLTFDELRKSLEESNEHFKDVTTLSAHIANINKGIYEGKVSNERLEQYKKELAVAKEILAIRSTEEDSSFNFMSNKIPGAQNNPINYFNNWAKAIQTLQTAMKTKSKTADGKEHKGLIDYQDWYNIATEMNNLAAVAGQEMEVAGVKLNGSMEAAAALIQKGAEALTVDSSGNVKVALGDIGIDFKAGTDTMSSNITTGIQEMAKSQVEMLDGMIKLMETIVAMEKLGDVDANKDHKIDLNEIFEGIEYEPGSNQQSIKSINKFKTEWNTVKGELLAAINSADMSDLKDSMVEVKFSFGDNIRSLYDLLKVDDNFAKGLNDAQAKQYAAIMNAVYQAAISGDYSTENIMKSIGEVLAATGYEGDIEAGNLKLTIRNGVTLQRDENNNYVVGDFVTDNPEEAINALQMQDQGVQDIGRAAANADFKHEVALTGTVTIGKATINVGQTSEGKIFYHSKKTNKDYETINELIEDEYKKDPDKVAENIPEYKIEQGYTIVPKSTDDGAKVNKGQLKNLLGKTAPELEEIAKENPLAFKATYGIEWVPGTTDEDLDKIREASGLETKIVDITANVEVNNNHEKLVEAIESGKAGVQVEVTLNTDNADPAILNLLTGNYSPEVNGTAPISFPDGSLTPDIPETLSVTEPPKLEYNGTDAVNIDLNGATIEAEIGTVTSKLPEGAEGYALTSDIETVTGNATELKVTPASVTIDEPVKLENPVSVVGTSDYVSLSTTANVHGQLKATGEDNTVDVGTIDGTVTAAIQNLEINEVNYPYLDLTEGNEVEISTPIPEATGKVTDLKLTAENFTLGNEATGIDVTIATLPDLTLDANTDAAMKRINEMKEAARDITSDVKLGKNEVNTALSNNTNQASKSPVKQAIKVLTNEVRTAIDENVEHGLNRPVRQTITTKKGEPEATGNLGLATGNAFAQGTLMGELGPELVVSNGQYFIVGQNGPEMVNLADDAIVFNHLQTKSLLEKGMSSGRGRAVTNEQNAISYAKGNVNGGPAMASASAALSALKQLRAQWQALAGLSAKDLAGKGGGGGGGGNATFIKDLERWYNLLQEIAKLEEKITYQETLRNKLASDLTPNGEAYAKSQAETLKYLQREVEAAQQLSLEQEDYFKFRQDQLNKQSAFSELYTFDAEGQIKYASGKFAQLSELFGSNPTTGEANHTVKEQYDYLISQGYGYAMQYNESGEEIKVKNAKDEGGMKTAIEAFWAKIEADKSEMQDLHDSVEEQKKAVLEKMQAQNELLKEIEDNQIAVEQKVLTAIEDAAQREIDKLQDQKDAIQESNEALIEGLSNQLEKERQMYETSESERDLESKRRQLAILKRSGGSAAEISNLQKEINSASRDLYFNKQQEQIDAIQEASDIQIKKLEEQIDIMTESLEYQKEHGLLWQQVYDVMNRNPQDIADFIKINDSAYWGKSPVDLAQSMREDLFQADQYVAYRDTVTDELKVVANLLATQNLDTEWNQFSDMMTNSDEYKDTWGKLNDEQKNNLKSIYSEELRNSGDPNAAARKVWDSQLAIDYGITKKKEAEAEATGETNASGSSSKGSGKGSGGSKKGKGYGWEFGGQVYETEEEALAAQTKAYTAAQNAENKTAQLIDQTNGLLNLSEITNGITEKVGNIPIEKVSVIDYRYDIVSDTQHKKTTIYSNGKTTGPVLEAHTFKNGKCVCGQTQPQYAYKYNGTPYTTQAAAENAKKKDIIAAQNTYNKSQTKNNENELNSIKARTIEKVKKEASGGYVNHGLYELGELGTETVLTAQQTQILRNNILSNRPDSLISLLKSYNEAYHGLSASAYDSITDNSSNVVIEHAEVNMKVDKLADNYDSARAADDVMKEMLNIARKTNAQNRIGR